MEEQSKPVTSFEDDLLALSEKISTLDLSDIENRDTIKDSIVVLLSKWFDLYKAPREGYLYNTNPQHVETIQPYFEENNPESFLLSGTLKILCERVLNFSNTVVSDSKTSANIPGINPTSVISYIPVLNYIPDIAAYIGKKLSKSPLHLVSDEIIPKIITPLLEKLAHTPKETWTSPSMPEQGAKPDSGDAQPAPHEKRPNPSIVVEKPGRKATDKDFGLPSPCSRHERSRHHKPHSRYPR